MPVHLPQPAESYGQVGGGISYSTKVSIQNIIPRISFSATLLFSIFCCNAGLNCRLNDLFFFTLAGNYSHISGRIRLPNKGMNFPILSLGVDFKIDPVNLTDRSRNKTKRDIHDNLFRINLATYASMEEADEYIKEYLAYGFEFTGS